MNYTEAIELAKNGNEAGYNFLYETTYRSKYYLALKYMQNEEAAKDVVQDAYIRAFEKLDTLEAPESFASWLGMIVANTAKNALQKKNPMLFSDIAEETEEEFEYQIEDDHVQGQPELAYSQKETQALVHELIDSLSEEQRMCILMFHIEGQSIREIAEMLGCSENTVKSRLNYGRKNIRGKAEELQKKGYKLYSFAPVPFLLYLLRSEQKVLAAQGAFDAAGKTMAAHISETLRQKALVRAVGAKGATGAVKRGFIHTLAGKITVAGVGLCIAAGTA
ncbi:MAG: RNA polymerase sigma factor, partial [Clostridiales bacterium]|nr:RNA polymerase sigma factor [Clostridiales bacterium]